jgi:methylenetetrahydrofolate dehydrogenase (NADP+)/methenyltetrahydrofolate cyclohydrolase
MKRSWAKTAGIATEAYSVDESWSQHQLLDKIAELNANPLIHGVMVQHPLPSHLDEPAALLTILRSKDVDGIGPASLGRLASRVIGHRTATPLGIMRLLDHYNIPIKGKHVVVVGCSVILGLPASLMFLERNATISVCHRYTEDVPGHCRQADILLTAVGRPKMFKGDWVSPGAVVVDAGFNHVDGEIVGDVDYDEVSQVASWITPVPGGVGPMTVATLLSNVVDAAEAVQCKP